MRKTILTLVMTALLLGPLFASFAYAHGPDGPRGEGGRHWDGGPRGEGGPGWDRGRGHGPRWDNGPRGVGVAMMTGATISAGVAMIFVPGIRSLARTAAIATGCVTGAAMACPAFRQAISGAISTAITC